MRSVKTVVLGVALAAVAAGCRSTKTAGECKSDPDCVAQHGVCIQGTCRECGRDEDCKSGFSCRENKCAPAAPAQAQAAPAADEGDAAKRAGCQIEPVHFGFNDDVLDEAGREVLRQDAQCIAETRDAKEVEIAGHADERGTEEYNLHLGQRRAEAAKRYIQGLGAAKVPVKTLSYGENKPVDPGHDEAAWRQNRRAEVSVDR
jgi:peptidoglycan-associated lipoprotein